jgi:hypothetical protein
MTGLGRAHQLAHCSWTVHSSSQPALIRIVSNWLCRSLPPLSQKWARHPEEAQISELAMRCPLVCHPCCLDLVFICDTTQGGAAICWTIIRSKAAVLMKIPLLAGLV